MYAGYCNHFNIGAFMEKGLTMAAGQVSHQAQQKLDFKLTFVFSLWRPCLYLVS